MSWITNTPPIGLGQSDTNGALAQCLGQQYAYRASTSLGGTNLTTLKVYRLVKNNSGGTLATGAALVESWTTGVRNGNVTTTTTVNDNAFAGIVPEEFGSNTVTTAAYFLMQVGGPGRPQFANTASTLTYTATCGGALGTASTAGYMQLVVGTATGTAAAVTNDIGAYLVAGLAIATNSAAVTAAGQLGYAELNVG